MAAFKTDNRYLVERGHGEPDSVIFSNDICNLIIGQGGQD